MLNGFEASRVTLVKAARLGSIFFEVLVLLFIPYYFYSSSFPSIF